MSHNPRYVFDTSSLSIIIKNYYEDTFPTLWKLFNEALDSRTIISVREVRAELENSGWIGALKKGEWLKNIKKSFLDPTEDELTFIKEIYKVPHFKQNISKQAQLKKDPVADPYVIAKAKILNIAVVTDEAVKENAAKIPNICKHFDIKCTNLQGFMKENDWVF